MSRRAALASALLTTLATPATWPMALAAFLLRGGLLVVILPIVVLPSPVGIGNVLAPTLTTLVFRGVSTELVVLGAGLLVAIVGWIVVGGLLAAALEAEAAAAVLGDDEARGGRSPVGGSGDSRRPTRAVDRATAIGILAARIVAHVPTGIATMLGAARLVSLTYRELTSPFDVATPIAIRVIRAAPEVVLGIGLAWMIGEIVGGLAARRIALEGQGVRRSLLATIADAFRHPLAVLLDFWVPLLALVAVAAPSALAASATLGLVRLAMRSPGEAAAAALAVVLFVAIWVVGLVLIAVTVAWRGAVWSMAHQEIGRRHALAAGGEPG